MMSTEKTNSEKLYLKMMAQKPDEVRVALSQMDKAIKHAIDNKAYQDCAKLIKADIHLREYLRGEREYEQIKDELYFVNQKIGVLISKAIKQAKRDRFSPD